MSYQVLARKWRPTMFQQMVGQEHVVQALVNSLDGNRLHHAYLFTGTRGVGKTTIARIFAKALNCELGIRSDPCGSCSFCVEVDENRSLDLLEIDAASRTGVEDMRELLENVQYAPTRSRFKIYLIDEVHMLSKHSFNALLKTLEEPPAHIKFLLATTDPQKIPVTVLSRCLQFNLKPMSKAQIQTQLEYLTEQEKIDSDPMALAQLAGAADGSMRDALSLLDQAIGYGSGAVRREAVESMLGTISRDYLQRIFDALLAQQASAMIQTARQIIEQNPDYQRVCAEMLSWIQQVALYQTDPQLVAEIDLSNEMLQQCSQAWSVEETQLYYQIILQGRQDLLICPEQAAGFEMLMLRLLAFAPVVEELAVDQRSLKKKSEKKSAPKAVPMAVDRAQNQPRQTSAENEHKETEGAGDRRTHLDNGANEIRRRVDTHVLEVPVGTDFDWPGLGYQLGLNGLAQEIVANCACELYRDGSLQLALLPEIHELMTDPIKREIRQALNQKLGVSLRLQLVARESLPAATPLQVKTQRMAQQRLCAIEAIKTDPTVLRLAQAFAAELDESSVTRLETNSE